MKFLDAAGVQQFKNYNDTVYVKTEDVLTVDPVSRDTYTKDEIDDMLEDFIETESDPVFSASAAAGIQASDITNWNSKTSNTGTITGITMNGASKGTSGVVNLGTVLTEHQDISGKADKSAAIGSLSLSLDSTNYKITLSGTKVDGTSFTVSNVIDLPLESVVVNGSYNNTTKKVVLTLQNGNTVDFSVADLVSGLQSEITSSNKLSADLISDGTTNKTVTATEKSTWNGKQDAISDLATIRSNAEAGAAKVSNVQSDWNATSGLAQILNKPTIPSITVHLNSDGVLSSDVAGTFGVSRIDGNEGAVYALGSSNSNGTEDYILATTNQLPTESTVSGWGFTKNAGTITGITMNGSSKGTSGVVNLGTVVTSETDPVYSASAAAGITSSDITSWNNKVSNVQSDWNATTGAAVILNKPTIPTAVTESTVSGWGFAKTASPALTGTPTAPTASVSTNNTQIATTAFVRNTINAYSKIKFLSYSTQYISSIDAQDLDGCYETVVGMLSDGYLPILIISDSAGTVYPFYIMDDSADSEGEIHFCTLFLSSPTYKLFLYGDGSVELYSCDTAPYITSSSTGNQLPTAAAVYNFVGSLNTTNTTAQTTSASEKLTGTINLHKVAKTGTYSDLIGTPTIPTESTVSGWGFTKNSGTVTGVKMNGTTKTPTSGTVDLGTVITSETSLSKGTTTGNGNAVTDISVSGHTITLTKGSTFLTSETQLSKGTTSGSGNVVTDLSVSGHTVTLTKGSTVPVATSANAGKIPMITSSGGWEYVTPSAIYSGSGTPSNGTGNNGDIYLQTS